MVTDSLLFTTLFTAQPGFDVRSFQYHQIRNILHHFPDKTFIFGEGGCDRLAIPIPACILKKDKQPELSASFFATSCLISLAAAASKVKAGEKLVLLLVGHGRRSSNKEFRLCISTTSGRDAEAWISKEQLECAVMDCQGDVLVVSNACYSGGLESDYWELLCASQAHEQAEALSVSSSGIVRGSAFAVCAFAAAGQEQGIVLPLPRSVPRTSTSTPLQMADLCLPCAPPEHSFTKPIRPLEAPSNQPMSYFVNRMKELEQYLIFASDNKPQSHGFGDDPWHRRLPITLTQDLVDSMTTYPEKSTTNVDLLNEAFRSQGSSRSSLALQRNPLAPASIRQQLDILAPHYALLPKHIHAPEGQDAGRCLRYIREPTLFSMTDMSDLVFILHSRNIQSVVAQLMARNLGWWIGSTMVPFLSLKETGEGQRVFKDMVEAGIPLADFCIFLLDQFEEIWSGNDRASVWWLAMRWQDFGRPELSIHQWSLGIKAAAKEAAGLVLLK
ncbi:hypothetical protein C8J56DRAFT_1045496 [Mycena floridula]|nr:hypothetical protein C8J56DRAFT_1045496 [Mycena floridula]